MFSTQIAICCLVAAIDPECQALIDAHSQTLELIRTIQVKLVTRIVAGKIESRKQVNEIWWSRDGQRERIRRVSDMLNPTADGRPRGISDALLDGDTYKWLRNWDPKSPQKITPVDQGTVRAMVGPQTGINPAGLAPSHALLFEVYPGPRRTLHELAEVSPTVTCKGKVQVDGRELWLISLETPEETTATTTKRYFDVYLDPRAGYMVRKVVMTAPRVLLGDGTTTKDRDVNEVVDFKDLGGGIFVPTKITTKAGPPGNLGTEMVVTSIKVNEPIPPETFEMEWPKYAAVHYYPPVDGKLKMEVWGDGKSLREFHGPTDLRAFEAELRKDPLIAAELGPEPGVRPPVPASTMLKLTIALGAWAAVVVALIVVRRIREQAA